MEQAVTIHLRLDNNSFGSHRQREAMSILQDQLSRSIEDANIGEFDGDLVGKGEHLFFMYGPDANRLFEVIEPILKSSPSAAGGYAVKRYGEAGDPNAQEIRVTW